MVTAFFLLFFCVREQGPSPKECLSPCLKGVRGAVASPSISFRVFTITTLFHGFFRESRFKAERRDKGREGEGIGKERGDWEGEGRLGRGGGKGIGYGKGRKRCRQGKGERLQEREQEQVNKRRREGSDRCITERDR